MSAAMTFQLLGPLTVCHGQSELRLPRGRQRAILAALLLNANHVVPAQALAETLWADDPPPSAPVTIRNHIRRLRQMLGAPGRERIVTHPRGYLIRVGDDELDLTRFGRLLAAACAAARSRSWAQAAAQAEQALSLWRGEPLADIDSQTLSRREVPRLTELRLQAVETRTEARLHLGEQAEAVAELRHLAASHPLREHVHALLMLALYRCGRQADALAAYQNVRRLLVEELGAEPGTELQDLHGQILAADPALEDKPAATVPRQLPAAVAQFTGRDTELTILAQTLDQTGSSGAGTVMISAIGGTAGVGKTALALHWAHQIASRFPGGQLYADLRGFDPSGMPTSAAEVIRGFLDGLGVAPERIPVGLDAQAGLYRSLMADRRILVVLDNAASEQQARPLLPASPGSLVIVTSRNQLTALAAADGARLLTLDVLPEPEARQMLITRIGAGRARAEPEAVAEIARLCACLPLALAVAAARAQARPSFPLGAVAGELRDAATRLEALDADDPGSCVQAVFSWSYRQLTPEAARMFRLLGLHPGPDISVAAAASLTGLDSLRARRLLGQLARAHLHAEHLPGRYRFHDLLRSYAASQARVTDSEQDRDEATGRLLDHYLHTAHRGAAILSRTRTPISLGPGRTGVRAEHFAGYDQALAWFKAEHDVLRSVITLAADTGFDVHAWQIPWTMVDFVDRQGHWHEQAAIERTALAAATRLGDSQAQASAHLYLANACVSLGDYDQAHAHLAECVRLYQQAGDRIGEAHARMSVTWVNAQQGRHADALAQAEQGLRAYQAAGHQAGLAEALNAVGWCHTLLGNHQQALQVCRQAMIVSREVGNRYYEAQAWDSLGDTEHQLGHDREAADCHRHALRLYRDLGDRYLESQALTGLGDSSHATGAVQQARHAWQQALDILVELNHRDAGQVRARLDSAASDPGPQRAAAQAAAPAARFTCSSRFSGVERRRPPRGAAPAGPGG
jgi:DNA-binding SARP family transcriptional activator